MVFVCLCESGPRLLSADPRPATCLCTTFLPPAHCSAGTRPGPPRGQGAGQHRYVVGGDLGPGLPAPRGSGSTHTLTLCLPMMKEIFLLHGLMKLDQLVSSVMYSPFRARNRMGE